MKKTSTSILFALISLSAYNSYAQQKATNQPNPATMTASNSIMSTLTSQERDYAVKFLAETESGVYNAVKDLSADQLTYKAAPEKWSIAECLKHIAAAEETLWAMVDKSLKQPENPESRSGIKFTDQELVKAVEDRSHKSKTFEALEPANSPYSSAAEALNSFKENREKLIAFVKYTRLNLRNHVSVLPIGTYDAYQFILLISAHSNRHTQQIEEVKANANFPVTLTKH